MPNGTTSIIIYPAFDINVNNQGREGLRGNFPLLSIWGGRGRDGKQFFWRGGVVVAHPKKGRLPKSVCGPFAKLRERVVVFTGEIELPNIAFEMSLDEDWL